MRNDREIPEKTLQTTPLEDSQSAGRVAGWLGNKFLFVVVDVICLACCYVSLLPFLTGSGCNFINPQEMLHCG